MYWLEVKYVLLLSSQLQGFKKRNNVYNFRCPICHDSEKSKKKTRGYLISRAGKAWFFCHNCGASMPFEEFLLSMNPELHSQYILEKLTEKQQFRTVAIQEETTNTIDIDNVLNGLKKVSQLALSHPVRKYLDERKIPTRFHYKIFYCPKFKQWVNNIIPDKFESLNNDEPRLIFALLDKNKKIFGVNARTLGKSEPKYITIKFDEKMPKVFGLESIDSSKDIFVFEGPIDSMMISNAIATCGGVLTSEISHLEYDKESYVLVFDNEPRKPETVAHIEKAIRAGYRVVLLNGVDKKDANALICEGTTPLEYKTMLRKRTFQGLEAELEFAYWRKC
jgi:transcription elongation factor Elf1